MSREFDLIVIGGGPAGYHGAAKAASSGLSTCLIERGQLGGTCLNEGCIPSKTFLASSKIVASVKHASSFAVTVSGDATIDMAALQTRKNSVADQLRKGIAFTLKKSGVTIINAEAKLEGCENGLFRVIAGEETLLAKKVLLCTGSKAAVPSIPGVNQSFVWTNREALEAQFIPKKLVVIGAGVIGLELATFFAEAGSSVTIVEMLSDIAGGLVESDISSIVKKPMEKTGVEFLFETKVKSIGDHTVEIETNGETKSIEADVVLLAVGRRADTDSLGLDKVGIISTRGMVETDSNGRTNVEGIWAAGDINGRFMLAHAAYAETEAAVADMLGANKPADYTKVPSVIYTHPEVAWIGHTVESATGAGFDVAATKIPLTANGRYLAETASERGLCKVIYEKGTGKLLGVFIVGLYAGELISIGSLALANGLCAADFEHAIFAHPTVAEAIRDTVVMH